MHPCQVILLYPSPHCYKGLQSACIKVLNYSSAYFGPDSSSVLQSYLAQKLQVTLKSRNEEFVPVDFVNNWFFNLQPILSSANPFVRVCWLRTVCGGWTTSVRMHHDIIWPCVFGCTDYYDEITHYFACPCLWQFARETLKLQENSISVGARLCLSEPSFDKLSLLAFCHTLYHTCIHDPGCFSQDGEVQASVVVQDRATQLARIVEQLILVR